MSDSYAERSLRKSCEDLNLATKQLVDRFSSIGGTVKWQHFYAQPTTSAFSIPQTHDLVQHYIEMTGSHDKGWVDPFCGLTPFQDTCLTNDKNPAFEADSHLLACEFMKKQVPESFAGGIFAPPKGPRQNAESYGKFCHPDQLAPEESKTSADWWATRKRAFARLIRPGGYAIMIGYNSNGFGKNGKSAFQLIEGQCIGFGGAHNDLIVTVFQKVQGDLFP